ncbi:Type-1 restriction enzyme EcoKI specificity protein [Pseudomonas oleovorans subsp. oleovorans]|uniref:Type I restriction-modification system, S subunit n=2 Tax=Ectopseudomonas oleovorans TaxID=301 RepID=A0A379JQP2_ECTOL|nr:Type-1 restriction enzyme EcoKI specificity protein [Pseudomonas oleovorans subsp. oleovorans]SEJ13138.1 type I restriction enzyme, S subunit [Pseudomonas oleovorans]SUD50760.1 type I restriction-modification system, S subunit [Pseudomonas oleovorans]
MTCAGPRSRCGVICHVPKTRSKLIFSGKIYRFRPNAEHVEPKFLTHLLRTAELKEKIDEIKTGISESGMNMTRERFFALPVRLAPLAEQTRIAQKLDELLAQVDTLKARIDAIPALLKRFRQSVLAAAVSGRLTEEWRSKNPIHEGEITSLLKEVELERLKALQADAERVGRRKKYNPPAPALAEKLPEIPSSWTWASVDTLASKVVDGVHKKPDYKESGVPFITVKNLTAGNEISFTDTKFVSIEDHKEFYKRANPEMGDILISKDGTLGVVRQIKTNTEFSIFVSVALVKPALRSMSDYLEIAFKSPQVQAQMVGVGSGLQHIHLTDLRQDAIPLPTKHEQTEIVRRVDQLFAFADQLEAKVASAKSRIDHLTQSILAKAFRGELVPQDPNDEPASVLLERIKTQRAAAPKARRGRKASA